MMTDARKNKTKRLKVKDFAHSLTHLKILMTYLQARYKELKSSYLFVDSLQQSYGTEDPIKTVMKSEKDGNHNPSLLRIRVSSLRPPRLKIL